MTTRLTTAECFGQTSIFGVRLVTVLLMILTAGGSAWSEEKRKPINLLGLSGAKIERTNAKSGNDVTGRLIDGDSTTRVNLSSRESSIEIVFDVGSQIVTADELRVHVPAGAVPFQFELLTSITSSRAGFTLLRTGHVKTQSSPQQFPFGSKAAKWVLLRITPLERDAEPAISEIELLGTEGPPTTNYAFAESPARALVVLGRLKTHTPLGVSITADEMSLFKDAEDGTLDQWSFAEAALLASGIKKAAKRKTYLRQIDRLEKNARKVTESARDDFQKGEILLAWLHGPQGPLAAGYKAHQTDVSVLLNTRTFNCVSSATLYNILGRRLGLDVRAIEVPDHAFSILYDKSRHADVETTNGRGFNPARDPEARALFEKQTGFRYIPDRHRGKRREIGEAGLVAVIYYNHGVTLAREEKYQEALLSYFRAMSLDPEFNSAIKNSLSSLVNWGLQLSKSEQFELATDVISVVATRSARRVAQTQSKNHLHSVGRRACEFGRGRKSARYLEDRGQENARGKPGCITSSDLYPPRRGADIEPAVGESVARGRTGN